MEDDKNPSITTIKAGMQLKQAREMLGMTQKDLAESLKTPIKPELIQQYEAGEISVRKWCLLELAEALGVYVDYFFPDHKIVKGKALYSEFNMRMITIMNRVSIEQEQAILSVISAFNKANKKNRENRENKVSKENGAKD